MYYICVYHTNIIWKTQSKIIADPENAEDAWQNMRKWTHNKCSATLDNSKIRMYLGQSDYQNHCSTLNFI